MEDLVIYTRVPVRGSQVTGHRSRSRIVRSN